MKHLTTFATIGAFLGVAPGSPLPSPNNNATGNITNPQDFADIPVTPDLNWIRCFDRFLCTNLQVPLDYEDDSAGTTNIAYIKLEGGNGSTQDILFNPGGPGGSGVAGVFKNGDMLLAEFGDGYNLVSFDPRGVNNSGPSATCFPHDPESRQRYDLQSFNLQTVPIAEGFQRAKAYGERCTAVNKNTSARYVSSSAVSQDMLYFTQLQAEANGASKNDAKVWYYGVSYGTDLGQNFAALFPDKVGRMILDGNVYAPDWNKGNLTAAVTDTDAALRTFFQSCVEAGIEKCSFLGNSTDAEELEARYNALRKHIQNEPIVISDPSISVPDVITLSKFDYWVFNLLYFPLRLFPMMDQALTGLEQGNATIYLMANGYLDPVEENFKPDNVLPNPNYQEDEGLAFITCVDINTHATVRTLEDYESALKSFSTKTKYFGISSALGTGMPLTCASFGIVPPESQQLPIFNEPTKTNAPILFINTVADPVTPLINAQRASKLFDGSVVLTQEGAGHSHFAGKSECTTKYVQGYFRDGSLPEKGTVCENDVKPFDDIEG